MNKYYVLILFIILLKYPLGYCDDCNNIPKNPEEFMFVVKHTSGRLKQKEEIIYKKKIDRIVGSILIEKINQDGKKKIFKKSADIEYFVDKSELKLVSYLNHIKFMKIPNTINGRKANKKSNETKTEFVVRFKHNDKVYHKKIIVINIENQLKDLENDNVFKLEFILLYFDELEYFIFTDP